MAPKLEDYDWGSNEIKLGIHGIMQYRNASLALQMCNIWLRDHEKSEKFSYLFAKIIFIRHMAFNEHRNYDFEVLYTF